MKHIWAPWRMEFIEGHSEENGCVFCEIPESKDDARTLILWRGDHCYVVMNRFPYSNGHLLIVPNKHTADLNALDDATRIELMRLMGQGSAILKESLNCEGINGGLNLGKAAGAGIMNHLHFHLVPRWVGDHNFLPVIGDTRHMPEYLENTFKRLEPGFKKLAKQGVL